MERSRKEAARHIFRRRFLSREAFSQFALPNVETAVEVPLLLSDGGRSCWSKVSLAPVSTSVRLIVRVPVLQVWDDEQPLAVPRKAAQVIILVCLPITQLVGNDYQKASRKTKPQLFFWPVVGRSLIE